MVQKDLFKHVVLSCGPCNHADNWFGAKIIITHSDNFASFGYYQVSLQFLDVHCWVGLAIPGVAVWGNLWSQFCGAWEFWEVEEVHLGDFRRFHYGDVTNLDSIPNNECAKDNDVWRVEIGEHQICRFNTSFDFFNTFLANCWKWGLPGGCTRVHHPFDEGQAWLDTVRLYHKEQLDQVQCRLHDNRVEAALHYDHPRLLSDLGILVLWVQFETAGCHSRCLPD